MHLGVLYLHNLWFFLVAFFTENLEEGGLPRFIISSSLPELLEECVHIFNAVRWQCYESFCWDARFTWRLVVSKFGNMMLDLGCRRGHTQRVESGAMEDVIQGEISRLASGIVAFFWAAAHGNFASFCANLVKVLLLRLTLYLVEMMAGGLPMLLVCIRPISKEVFICTLGSVMEGLDDGFTGIEPIHLTVFGFGDGAFRSIHNCFR